DGYRDVMTDVLGEYDPRLVEESDFTPSGGERAMRELLDRCPDVDAVFAANDLTALGALRVLRANGRRVPEDVAVVGFDDMVPVTEQADPPLTTVRQDIEEMGRLMARLLLRGLSGAREGTDTTAGAQEAPPSEVILPTTLIRRASA
ncbi:LacI family DNA-binding transcriptional regulator, partial [Streptomyces olivaceoviridis]